MAISCQPKYVKGHETAGKGGTENLRPPSTSFRGDRAPIIRRLVPPLSVPFRTATEDNIIHRQSPSTREAVVWVLFETCAPTAAFMCFRGTTRAPQNIPVFDSRAWRLYIEERGDQRQRLGHACGPGATHGEKPRSRPARLTRTGSEAALAE